MLADAQCLLNGNAGPVPLTPLCTYNGLQQTLNQTYPAPLGCLAAHAVTNATHTCHAQHRCAETAAQ